MNILYLSWLATYIPLGIPQSEIESKFININNQSTVLSSYLKSTSDDDIRLVASKNNNVIGLCFGKKENSYFKLNQLYLHPKFVGQGIGALILDCFINKTRGNDVKLSVYINNLKAINFYKENGFVETPDVSLFELSKTCIMEEKVLIRHA